MINKLRSILLNALILFGIIILKNLILKPIKVTELFEIGDNLFNNQILGAIFSILIIYILCMAIVSIGGMAWWVSDSIRVKALKSKD